MSTCNWIAYDVISGKGGLSVEICGGGVSRRVFRTMGTVLGGGGSAGVGGIVSTIGGTSSV